jgi:hypothetical protein
VYRIEISGKIIFYSISTMEKLKKKQTGVSVVKLWISEIAKQIMSHIKHR